MIRKAEVKDIPEMVEMGRRFFAASGFDDITQFDPASLEATFKSLVGNKDAVVLVVEKQWLVGLTAALVYPFYFNLGHRTSQEMLWWVDAEHRGVGGQLLDALIAGVKAKGAESLSMIALDALDPEKVGAIYERRGFRASERLFIRRL